MPRVTLDREAVADLDAIYRPIDDGIDVLRVFEGHRDYPAVFRADG